MFEDACKKFYIDNTNQRLDKFFEKTSIHDKETVINGMNIPSVKELFSKIDWNKITEGIPCGFHGDLQFDNVLSQDNGEFKILDWRQDFAGLIEYGDIYYDLAKLYDFFSLPIFSAIFDLFFSNNDYCQ